MGEGKRVEFRAAEAVSCDFCLSSHPVVQFPARSFEHETHDPNLRPFFSGVVQRFIGNWMACERCRELVEADDREALLQRWMEFSPTFRMIGTVAPELAEAVVEETRALHARFFGARSGDPIPV